MAADFSAFQQVLEALQRAKEAGAAAIAADTTTSAEDDLDCYPRGILLLLERTDPKWPSLRFLAKHVDWVELSGKHVFIAPPQPLRLRVSEAYYQGVVANSLKASGIPCLSDVNYH